MDLKNNLIKYSKELDLWRLIIYTFLLYLVSILFFKHRTYFVFFLLLFLASVSRIYNHFIWFPQLGLEFYSGATILTAYLLGPVPGMIQGLFSNFFAHFFSGKIKYYTYISMISWAIIGFVAGYFKYLHIDISVVGIISVLIYNIVTQPIFVMSGARLTSSLFNFFTHILLSLFMFRTIVPMLYLILR